MAKMCTWFTESPRYERCFNHALPGKSRCTEHFREVQKRPRQFGLTEEVKQYVRQRDDFTCMNCGNAGYEVDHIVELAEFSGIEKNQANLPSNLQTLCRECHLEKTNRYRREAAIETNYHDRSISARARKKQRMRKRGFYTAS